jgi:Mg2+/Co2+ transporter CorB
MIFLPGRKADCMGLMTLLATVVNLLASTLVKILKLTLSKQIGLYYWMEIASELLGIKMIVPKLIL